MAVDYDPIKAHEYYMKHRKLKGRANKHSTKGFSETQKQQWDYAKHQLSEEHKSINTNISESAKKKKEELANRAKDAIENLRARFAQLPPSHRKALSKQIQNMISSVRSQLSKDKSVVSAKAKSDKEKEKQDYVSRQDEAYEHIKGSK